MNILDEIVNRPAERPNLNLAHSFEKGAQITAAGLRHVEQAAEMAVGAYRGLGADVSACNNDAALIAERADLAWKTVPMPLAIQGKREVRPYPGMVALVRSDNGAPLAVATDSYKPHQNAQLLETMSQFAAEAGLKLARVGTFADGARGFAVATSGVSAEAKVGDLVSLHIVLRFGHAPGTATQISAWANELRCSNGACIPVAKGKARFVHSAELTPKRIETARAFVEAAAHAFGGHVQTLRELRAVPSNKGLDLLLLAELFQPDLAAEISNKLRPADADLDHNTLGRRVLSALFDRDDSQRVVAGMIAQHGDRLLNRVIEATVRQPGGAVTVGTMAHAYSGVTNYNSNVRGRRAETGLESNLFGTAQQDTQRALALAVEVAQRVQTIH